MTRKISDISGISASSAGLSEPISIARSVSTKIGATTANKASTLLRAFHMRRP